LGSVDGNWNSMVAHAVVITTMSWYTVRVHVSGSQIDVYLDDTLVIGTTDNTWSSGSVGLRTYRNRAAYGSVLVCD
jgi:pectate lyase